LPILSDEARKRNVSRPLSFCKAREQRPGGRWGSREADLPGKNEAKPSSDFRTENERLYRIISKGLKELGYFFLKRGKNCPVEKRMENIQGSVKFQRPAPQNRDNFEKVAGEYRSGIAKFL
jgi:hypothetical protein